MNLNKKALKKAKNYGANPLPKKFPKIKSLPPPCTKCQNTINKINKKMKKLKLEKDLEERRIRNEKKEKEKFKTVYGILKSAESKRRTKLMMMNYRIEMDRKLDMMVYSQPTSLMAVRTEYMIKSQPLDYRPGGKWNKASRDPQFQLSKQDQARLRFLMENELI